jgi:hypothetical protein
VDGVTVLTCRPTVSEPRRSIGTPAADPPPWPSRRRREVSWPDLGRLADVLPRIAPMKAVTGELLVGDAWAFEVKWDGMLH